MRIGRRHAFARVLLVALLCSWLTKPLFCADGKPVADGELKIAELGRCKLESGQYIEQCRIGYRTWGKLNADGSNAVLFPTWYQGRSEDLAGFFAPGGLVDTTRYFGVAIDALGDGVSSSPSNSEVQRGTDFPAFTIRDMVNTQYRVATEVLKLKHVHAVIGISMGGYQTFEWAVSYPDFFDLAVPIVGSPMLTSRDVLMKQTLLDAMLQDPGYNGGRYTVQPSFTVANELVSLNLTTPANVNRSVPRPRAQEWLESMRHPQRQDANDRIWQLKAVAKHDVLRGREIQAAARESKPRFIVVVNANDHMVNPQPAIEWANAMGAQIFVSQTDCGHQVFDCDGAKITAMIRDFLAGK